MLRKFTYTPVSLTLYADTIQHIYVCVSYQFIRKRFDLRIKIAFINARNF